MFSKHELLEYYNDAFIGNFSVVESELLYLLMTIHSVIANLSSLHFMEIGLNRFEKICINVPIETVLN